MAWPELAWIDVAMLGVLALSAIVGALRGLTFEVLSLVGWVVAWFTALWLGPWIAPYIPVGSAASALNHSVAFACAFLVVLVLWGLLARGVSALVGRTVLRPIDRLLGAVFGLVRGMVVLLALAMVVAYTPLAAAQAWRASIGAAWLNVILGELVPLLSPQADEPPGTGRV